MSADTVYELIGYLGSALIVVSLAMSSIIRLRIVNLAGAVVFSFYGVLIGSIPVIVTNVIISGLDIWYLRKELTTRPALTVVPVDADDAFMATFVELHHDDLSSFVVEGSRIADGDIHFVMLRDANVAGVFVGTRTEDDGLDIVVDYVAKPYRDLKSGALLYGQDAERFRQLGISTIRVPVVDRRQAAYFRDMGFAADGPAMVRTVGST